MKNVSFIFRLSPYNTDKLLPQTAKALEKRMELLSRKRYPRLSNATDRLNDLSQGRTRSKTRIRILSVIYLLLGLFLLIPGLVKPEELTIPLIIGAIGVCYGILGLWSSRKGKKNRFERSAGLLLAGKDTFSVSQNILVSFSESGMILPAAKEKDKFVPYDKFECMIETEDLFLFVHDTRVTLLQKTDLTKGSVSAFLAFLSEHDPQYGAHYAQISG